MITYPIKAFTEDMQTQLIELAGVDKKYPLVRNPNSHININLKDFWALKDISFAVSQGQVLGVIGRNGAGKTTLLNIIAGTSVPTQGKVLAHGRVLGLFNLGVGFQDELTGRENVFLNGAILGASRNELEKKLAPILDFSELGGFIDMPLGSYSQGMRLRLGFSIVINLDFDIMVIDEVLAVGDALFQSKCFERLMDFRRSGKALIVTTQDMGLIERLCDKAILLDHGSLLYYGQPREAIERYLTLLSTEKFFVGPVQKTKKLIENTKKWAEDVSIWGEKLGTKEVVIQSVELKNKFGWNTDRIRSAEPLEVKVRFHARGNVKEPHFGVAIFRDDGVYCYGPNTAFDGHGVSELKPGKGYFILRFHKLLLAPGKYRISVAIWDKNETLAFDYHGGFYKLNVIGNYNVTNELLDMPFKPSRTGSIRYSRNNKARINLSSLDDKWGKRLEQDGMRIDSVRFFNHLNEEKSIFITDDPVRITVNFENPINSGKNTLFWLGLYREDKVYCQGITHTANGNKNFEVIFPMLPLLPGGYTVSIGIWDKIRQQFVMYHHGVYSFNIISYRQDHGTVFLEHSWKWGATT